MSDERKNFQVGDVVRCICNDNSLLTQNSIYHVKEIHHSTLISLNEIENKNYKSSRFELVTTNINFKVGQYVRCINNKNNKALILNKIYKVTSTTGRNGAPGYIMIDNGGNGLDGGFMPSRFRELTPDEEAVLNKENKHHHVSKDQVFSEKKSTRTGLFVTQEYPTDKIVDNQQFWLIRQYDPNDKLVKETSEWRTIQVSIKKEETKKPWVW